MTEPAVDIALGLYRHGGSEVVRLRELEDVSAAALAAEGTRAAHTAISITVDGRELLAGRRSMGPLWLVARQLPAAARRIAAGRPALVRSGTQDEAEGAYLYFEPAPDGQALLSLLRLTEFPAYTLFPDRRGWRQLYGYVAAHAEELIAAAQMPALRRVPWPRALAAGALRREARIAARFLERMGLGSPTAA